MVVLGTFVLGHLGAESVSSPFIVQPHVHKANPLRFPSFLGWRYLLLFSFGDSHSVLSRGRPPSCLPRRRHALTVPRIFSLKLIHDQLHQCFPVRIDEGRTHWSSLLRFTLCKMHWLLPSFSKLGPPQFHILHNAAHPHRRLLRQHSGLCFPKVFLTLTVSLRRRWLSAFLSIPAKLSSRAGLVCSYGFVYGARHGVAPSSLYVPIFMSLLSFLCNVTLPSTSAPRVRHFPGIFL